MNPEAVYSLRRLAPCSLAMLVLLACPASGQTLSLVSTSLDDRSEAPDAGLYVHNNLAFVGGASRGYYADENIGVRIVELSDPEHPQLISRIPLRQAYSTGNIVYSGAVATDLSTDAFEGTVAIVLSGVPDSYSRFDYAEPYGLWDVTDPANPAFLSLISPGSYPFVGIGDLGDYPFQGFDVAGNYFFALFQATKLQNSSDSEHLDTRMAVVDISDPRHPTLVGQWQDSPDVILLGLSVNDAGTRVYLTGVAPKPFGYAATEVRMYVVDVSNPESPTELGRYVMPVRGLISSAWIARSTADDAVTVLADGSWGKKIENKHGILHVLDTSDPANIRKLSEMDAYDPEQGTQGWYMAVDVAIRGTTVYSAWIDGGVVSFSISDPEQPVLVDQYKMSWTTDVAVFGGEYVLASRAWAQGLFLFRDDGSSGNATAAETDREHPVTFALGQNYPNPFNPTTKIPFDVPSASDVTLSVFDVAGRMVRTLVDAAKPAGTYTVEWDGRDTAGKAVTSGVYFYRLTTDTFVTSRRMVLLK